MTNQQLLGTLTPERTTGTRTAQVMWYSGASVSRYDWIKDEEYDLSFDMGGADLGRFGFGAPVMLNHGSAHDGGKPLVENVVGVVESAWIEDGRGLGTVRFTERESFAPIWQDMVDGIIGNVSMGVYIRELDRVKGKSARPQYLAKAWEPREISLVAIGADPKARAKAIVKMACESREQFLRSIEDAPERRAEFAVRAKAIVGAGRLRRLGVSLRSA